MRVLIVGAGEVGFQIAKFLALENIEVVVIDRHKGMIRRIVEELDVAVIEGEGGDSSVLQEANASSADMLLAVTDSDETNMISCLLAKTTFNIPRRIARIRNPDYWRNKQLLSKENLDIDPAINPEFESAQAIVRLLDAPFATSIEPFEDGLIYVIGCRILESSPIAGRRLKELRGKKDHVFLVGIIERGDQTIIPGGEDEVRPGDIIYTPVTRERIRETISIIGAPIQPARKVIINGGGQIGLSVAKTIERRIEVKIIDTDLERCKHLSKQLHKAIVLYGDGSERKMLLDENISGTDVYVAVTDSDELNIMSCLMAMKLGVQKTVAVVNRTDYVTLAHSLGLQAVLSPRLLTASTILRYVRRGDILSLTAVADGRAEMMETRVGESSSLAGVCLRDASLPRSSLIGAIIRGDRVIIPSGNDRVDAEDRLIIFTLRESIKDLGKLLA